MRCWLFNTSEAICPHAMLGFPSRGWAQSLLCYDYISCLVLYHSPLTNHQSPLRWLECLNSHVVVFPPLDLSYYFLWSEAPLLLFFSLVTVSLVTVSCQVWYTWFHQNLLCMCDDVIREIPFLILSWRLDLFSLLILLASCDDKMTIWPLTPRWPCATTAIWSSVMSVLTLRKQVQAHIFLLLCGGTVVASFPGLPHFLFFGLRSV